MSSQNDWKHTAAHAAHAVLHTEAGKRTAHSAVTSLAAVAPPALVAVGTLAAPVAIVGLIAWSLWSAFKK